MTEKKSLRSRIATLDVGGVLFVMVEEHAPSVVESTAYRLRRDKADGRNYRILRREGGVEVHRTS
jgi:hypothetical protein